jgi:hypothetical protein
MEFSFFNSTIYTVSVVDPLKVKLDSKLSCPDFDDFGL